MPLCSACSWAFNLAAATPIIGGSRGGLDGWRFGYFLGGGDPLKMDYRMYISRT